MSPIQYNKALKRQLSDTIRIAYRDAFTKDGSKPNMVIDAFLTKRRKIFDWRGPIIAYGMEGLGIDQAECRDLDLNDFRYIVDYMLTYAMGDCNDGEERIVGDKIQGVRINCHGDQQNVGLPQFQSVQVPTTHPIFTYHDVPEIPGRLKFPLFTRKYPPSPAWKDLDGSPIGSFSNSPAAFVHLVCHDDDLKAGLGWGWAPYHWQNSAGSVLVVRQDRRPLHPLHMEALARFCQYEMGPIFEHSMGAYITRPPLPRDVVMLHATPPFFEIFWGKFTEEKRKEGSEQIMDIVGPYDDS